MKKLVLSLTMLLATGLSGFASDFSVIYGDSVRIGFKILSTEDLTVSIAGIRFTSTSSQQNKHLVVPESVTYNNREYSVTDYDLLDENSAVRSITLTKAINMGNVQTNGNLKVFLPDLETWLNTNCSNITNIELYVNGELVTDLVIPEGITSIKQRQFKGYGSIKSVTIPNSVKTISANAFENCTALTTVTMAANSVETIDREAFKGCSNLTSVTLSNKLQTIPYGCFWNCTSLQEVKMGASVTIIDEHAFHQCESLKKINFPASLVKIGRYAFSYCKAIEEVTIPDFVESIGNGAFSGCSSINSLSVGNSVQTIGEAAFSNATSLQTLTIGSAVTSIGSSAFRNCSLLQSLTIPNSVAVISLSAFELCSNLKFVTFGSGVKRIGSKAFSNCKKITSITCLGEEPANIGSEDSFAGVVYLNATVNIPEGTIDAYRATSWVQFSSISEGTPVVTEYSVSVTAGKGGTVAIGKQSVKNGKMTVKCPEGDDVVLTITPGEGYRLVSVKVNGNDVTEDVDDGTYTLEALDGDTGITVSFELTEPERADVNEDGQVDSADVVAIYNRIIYGKGNEE